jgi:hypothetical protein
MSKGEQPAESLAVSSVAESSALLFKRPSREMARSFQRIDASIVSSTNTSFDTIWSSQQTQAESANTSFTTDGASDDVPFLKPTLRSSTSIESLNQDAVTALAEIERRAFQLEKPSPEDRMLYQETCQESMSTYNSIEDGKKLSSARHKAEAANLPHSLPALDPLFSRTNGASTEVRVQDIIPAITSKVLNPFSPRGARVFQDYGDPPLAGANQETVRTCAPTKVHSLESHDIRDIPQQNLFIDEPLEGFRDAPYFIRFICQRLAIESAIPKVKLLEAMNTPSNYSTSESFWTAIANISESRIRASKKKESARLWHAAKRDFDGYTFKGQISFSNKTQGPVFRFQLLPVQADKSCRFQRKFGADRFLYVNAPKFDSKLSDCFNKSRMKQIRERWNQWLSLEHLFLGRKWRVFHLEPIQNKKGKKTNGEFTHDKRIVLFATEGCGIEQPCTIGELLNWFLPFAQNERQTFCKAYARFDLGLSRTVPTLIFKPSQVRQVPDTLSDGQPEATEFNDPSLPWNFADIDRQVMNDGCSLISVGAAREIWRQYREAVGMKGPQALPSAFQGRIAGAKGMWIVSGESFSKDPEDLNVWIQINDSQLKFNPHEEDLLDGTFDPLRLTFELTNYTSAPSASELHISFIPILLDRGVSKQVIANMMTTRLDAERLELLAALADPIRMYEWLHRNGAKTSLGVDIMWQGALPVALEEKIKLMLESGFSPTKAPVLANALERFIQGKQVLKESKLRTPLGKSTFLYGIADPLGVLQPGEVHVQFSARFTDEVTEESYLHLRNMNILVARLPACRRSDIQKVRTIVHPDLSHLIDVVVFPSKGQYPLAGKLQGGDYDGDLFWLCWEPLLVDPFLNAPAPMQSLEPSTYNIRTDKRCLREVMKSEDLQPVDAFLKEAFAFRLDDSLLGRATTLLEKKTYRDNEIQSETLDQLCDLHDLLVDAPKQGYKFTHEDFELFKRETLRLHYPLKQPAYKAAMDDCLKAKDVDEVEKLRQKDYKHKPQRILDYLYFDVFRAHNTKTIKQINELFVDTDEVDKTLLSPYSHLVRKELPAIDNEIRSLKNQLALLFGRWSSGFHKSTTTEQKNAHAEDCYQAYHAIQPDQPDHADIKPWLEPYCGPDNLTWKFIKASTLYAKYPYPKRADFVFKMAGMELTELKARGFPRSRLVIAGIHANMKPKRIKTPSELDEDDGEESSDDEFENAVERLPA